MCIEKILSRDMIWKRIVNHFIVRFCKIFWTTFVVITHEEASSPDNFEGLKIDRP